MQSFEVWAREILFGAICINAEDQWFSIPIGKELQYYNPGLKLATTPWLLTSTIALLLFPSNLEVPEHVFAFTTYQQLANYRIQTPDEIVQARKAREEREKGKEKEKEKIGRVKGKEVSWAAQVEELEGEIEEEEPQSEGEIMDEMQEN
ncbi:hypothetical protein L873DRAFT_1847153 [Choiromyces venosus 120613-1]|uniref:Uncharacterized protein n=1 Tax=Choiromyces venosus 120613-1 TaxID=1336337 RepID=A0A3N4JAS3_9PEZI|nr:hypothetical protein L873DRAFT_1847153 [Choiromyces venosus 120613-1]